MAFPLGDLVPSPSPFVLLSGSPPPHADAPSVPLRRCPASSSPRLPLLFPKQIVLFHRTFLIPYFFPPFCVRVRVSEGSSVFSQYRARRGTTPMFSQTLLLSSPLLPSRGACDTFWTGSGFYDRTRPLSASSYSPISRPESKNVLAVPLCPLAFQFPPFNMVSEMMH